MKTIYSYNIGFKADLTLKVKFGMQFDRSPIFFGNQRASGMENGSFEVVSKTIVGKRFSRNEALRGMLGYVLTDNI
ncbi:hypothetical protein [Maribacter sp. R86514]|uniref:hypothetical protein n=1 Tax=Maribacter sp. R86514 TaxID=3093854 RepID=UPI0037C8B391